MAKKWEDKGSQFIHIVSLNGARGEGNVNDESIKKILQTVNIPIQIGGGIREEKRVKELLDLGVNRVILGSMAVKNKELLEDISKDGMMIGPNFDIYEKLSKETNLDIIASGGVTTIDDVKKLNSMNLYGAIIGKALYENKIELKEVLSLC